MWTPQKDVLGLEYQGQGFDRFSQQTKNGKTKRDHGYYGCVERLRQKPTSIKVSTRPTVIL